MVKTYKIFITFLLLLTILSASNLLSLDNVYAADLWVIVKTDKPVYNPGENVIIKVRVQKIVGGDMVIGVDGANVFVSIEPPGGGLSGEVATPTAILGEYSYTYTLPPTADGGVYKVNAEATHPGDNPGSDQTTFTVTGPPGKKTVDWRVENPWITPANPTTEDPVINNVWLRFATVSPGPFPVDIVCKVDGITVGGGVLNPIGPEMTVYTPAKKYSSGTHMVTWIVDPDHDYNDVNLSNNQVNFQFTVTTPAPEFDFSLSASPSSQTIEAGESTSYAITVTLTSGDTKQVTLNVEGLPLEATHTLSAPVGNPTFSSTVTIQTSESTPSGAYSVTIIGEGGGITKTTNINLNIEESLEEGFTLALSPQEREIRQGESALFTLTVDKVGGFEQPVTFIASGLPSGASYRFNPSSGTPSFTSTLIVDTGESAPAGRYIVTIEAGGGGKIHSATIVLTITEEPHETSTPTSTEDEETGSNLLNYFSSPSNLLLIIIIVILAAALIGIVFRLRRTPTY